MTVLTDHYQKLVKQLAIWCERNRLHLILEKPLDDVTIDSLPHALLPHHELATTYNPADFRIPDSYRAFLRLYGGLRVECQQEGSTTLIEPLHVFSPSELSKGYGWVEKGSEIDDQLVTTTDFIAFATARPGAYWCFYTRPKKGELPVYLMDNNYEFDLGHFVDSGKWINDEQSKPDFKRFDLWLTATIKRACKLTFHQGDQSRFCASFFGEED